MKNLRGDDVKGMILFSLVVLMLSACTVEKPYPELVLTDTPTIADTIRAAKPQFRSYLKRAVNKALILNQTVEVFGPLHTYSIKVTPVADWKSEKEHVGCRKLRIQIWQKGVLEQDGYALGCRPYKIPLVQPENQPADQDDKGIWDDFPVLEF